MVYTKQSKEGFSMIEAVVVITIIGILSLLASPKVTGHIEKVKITHIQNDSKVTEEMIDRKMVLEENIFESWEDIESTELKKIVQNGKLYTKTGIVKEEDIIEELDYKIIPEDFKLKEVKSKLKGKFYSDINSVVYYSEVEGSKKPDEEEITKPFIKTLVGDRNGYFEDVVQSNDDGYIAVGYSDSYNLYKSKGGFDGVIVKYDKEGNILWVKNYGGSYDDHLYSITKTTDGNYVVVGYSASDDKDLKSNKGYYDAIIMKIDNEGNLLWFKNYGGSKADYFNSVKETKDGGFIAVGYSTSSNGNLTSNKGAEDFIIARLDSEGNLLWIKNYGGTKEDALEDVQETKDGGFIAVGYSSSSTGDLTNNKGGKDFILARFNSEGTLLWIKNYGGSLGDHLNSLEITEDNKIIAVGGSISKDGDLYMKTWLSLDAILVKFDSEGNLLWLKNYGGGAVEEFNKIIKGHTSNNYVVCGTFQSNIAGLITNNGHYDYILGEFDSNGNTMFLKGYGSVDSEQLFSVALSKDGGYFGVGHVYEYSKTSDFVVIKTDRNGMIE